MAKYQIIKSKKAISYLLNRRNFRTLEKRDATAKKLAKTKT